MRFTLAAVLAVALVLLSFSSVAGNKTKFGFVTEVTATGYFSPKLKRAVVTQVVRPSPAHAAGLVVGDSIIEVNGTLLAGSSARQMAATMKDIKPGQALLLKVLRADKTIHQVSIVAGPET